MQFQVIRKRLASALALVGGSLALAGSALAQSPAVNCQVEWASMRDGVRLATEVYRPANAAALPVILQRTPYNRSPVTGIGSNCTNPGFMTLAGRGYTVLNQDVRGRYRSQGVMNAMVQEANDGYDAIEWAAAQPWSTGKVATTGGSYVGLTQWQPAIHTPPHLAAMVPGITASDYHDHWTYVEAAFDLWFAQSWMLVTFAGEQYMRNLEASGATAAEVQTKTAAWEAQGNRDILTKWVWQLPLMSFDVYRNLAPYYYDWLAHPTYDAFWARLDVENRYENVKVPALNSGAWYDIFQVGTVRNFQGMRTEAGTAQARAGTKLVLTCCGHAGTSGNVSWGPTRTDTTLTNRFFDRYLKGIDNGVEREPAVQMDILVPPDTGNAGTSFLLTANQFPLPGTRTARFDLRSGGNANTRLGDGVLVTHRGEDHDGEHEGEDGDGNASGSRPDRFVYDPRNPVPTKGGNMCCAPTLLPAGAHDQTEVELRNDVLVYTSAPLEQDVAVIGPVSVKLWAKSSARDTDFTAKLVDVHLDGYAHNVLDRIVRARYRWGSKLPPSPIQPGKTYAYTIDLGNAGTIFRRGHRIRLEISSSNFPHYARNLNTGRSNEQDDRIEVARQTVLHDEDHPSHLTLSTVPGVIVPAP
jgi:putative CocE/NonD family hydrolase